ncbi:MAG: (Fe-S)-binding protein [Fidelibacterota bacterium]
MDRDDILNCIHCGLCLPVCPTYFLTSLEKDSPRGRIRLIKTVSDGNLPLTDITADSIYFCLDCRACETACPAGVKFGELTEAFRSIIESRGYGGVFRNLLRYIILKQILISNSRIRNLARILRLYQKMGGSGILNWLTKIKLFPEKLKMIESISPAVPDTFSDNLIPEVTPVNGKYLYKVGFLSGCVMNIYYPEVNQDTVEVLEINGCKVYTPRNQVCCGSIHGHNGDFASAKKLARRNIEIFESSGVEAIITNSAGCSSFMKKYGELFEDERDFRQKAENFSKKVRDITEFLTEIDFQKPTGSIDCKITYHEPCHLVHAQGISDPPREILLSIPDVKFVELPESDWCCGSAGIYNITHYEESMILLERKVNNILKTGAEIVATGNPGCLIQLAYSIKKYGYPLKVYHPVSLLNRAYKGG